MAKRGAGKGKSPLAALSSSSFPRSIAWRVDADYVRELGPADRAWLAAFLDRYYGADFRGESPVEWSTSDRQERYRAKNAANRDMMTANLPTDDEPPERILEAEDALISDDSTWTESEAYRRAREAYRADSSPANRVRLARTVPKKR